MALFRLRREAAAPSALAPVEALLKGYSIEVMPRTAEKIADFRDLLPRGTRSISPISTARPSRRWWRPRSA